MRFVPDSALAPAQRSAAVACDGLCEAGLQLSHWKGNRTPARFKADLSTEMALAFAESEERSQYRYATNNHYDADGVLSLFACIDPEHALPQRDLLVKAAAFGDFQHGDDEEALKLAATLDGLAGPKSPLAAKLAHLPDPGAAVTEEALRLLPTLASDLPRYEVLWEDELGWFRVSRDALRSQELRITELPKALLTVAEWDAEAHPAVVDRAMHGDLVLHVIEGEHGFRYRADWRYYSWAETVSPQRPPIASLDLEKLCLPLNSLETNGRGRWMTQGYQGQGMTEALRFTTPVGEGLESHLQPTEVVQRLAWFLMERGKGRTDSATQST